MLSPSGLRFLAYGLAKLTLRCGRAFALVAPDGAGARARSPIKPKTDRVAELDRYGFPGRLKPPGNDKF